MEKETIKNCVLYRGDCYEIMPEISDADAMITDPPYGCTRNEWDYDIDLDSFWKLSKAACKQSAPFVIFCQMPFAARLYMSNPKIFRYEWIYVKPHVSGFLDANRKPLRMHELIYVFCEKMPEYRPQIGKGKPYKCKSNGTSDNYGKFERIRCNNSGERYPTSILSIGGHINEPEFLRHPTQKSVATLSYLVKTYTAHGDTLLDPFMGSGTTGVAAVRHGRKFIGIEKDAKWFDTACKRIEAEYEERRLLDYMSENVKESA